MSHEGKAGSKAVGVRAPEPSHHAWQNPTSTAGQSPAPKGRLPGTRSAGQPRHRHAREGGGLGASGSVRDAPGFGSVNNEHTESSTFEMVNAGLHWLCRMSRQMLPLLFTLQW